MIPIFFDGELVGFFGRVGTCSTSAAPTGAAIDLVDNWSEGNIYRAVKLQEQGVWQGGPWAHPRVRTASFNNGDIRR